MSSIQSFSGGSTDQNAAPPPSFRRSERSGEISRRCGASPMVAEDLSAQRFNKLQSLYPHTVSPPRDDHSGRPYAAIPEESINQNSAPPPSFRPKRNGEISRRSGASPMVAEDLPAQRFNSIQSLYSHTGRSPPLEMTIASGSLSSYVISQKGL